MSDIRNQLQGLFIPNKRFENFGQVLVRLLVKGFRAHENTLIEFDSPITAFCGLNGTGKSTLLQIATAAYKATDRYYISDFIFAGKLDSKVIRPDASAKYEYCQATQPGGVFTNQEVTVSRSKTSKRNQWIGYKRQPHRAVYFAGVGLYLPRVEERDAATRYASSITVSSTSPVSTETQSYITKILGTSYKSANENDVTAGRKATKVVSVERGSAEYSELHMGCGEGRIYHIVRALEALPEKSLVALEEPETSLHASSQYRFGQYLVDLAIRKRHQIIITTHSEFIMLALPERSRICLVPTGAGTQIIKSVGVRQAISLMSDNHVRALHILVEDDVAKALIIALLRAQDPFLLRTVEVIEAGDKTKIQSLMEVMSEAKLPVCAVRDGDVGANPKLRLFKLFGTAPPEKEIILSEGFKSYAASKWSLVVQDILAELERMTDHHHWFGEISRRTGIPRDDIIKEGAEEYLKGIADTEKVALVNQIKTSVS